jgi:20S proteasome alpha/beta subunit
VRKARKIAIEYEMAYGEEIPVIQLVTKIAVVMQEYTQSGLVFIQNLFDYQYLVVFDLLEFLC